MAVDERETFDGVAALYDAHRPAYPQDLFDDLRAIAGLREGAAVLEVGCGTGQATEGLVGSGFLVTATDPGAQLIGLARERFDGVEGVQFEIGAFEALEMEPASFDLIAAAQSWHWVPAEMSYVRAASLLRPGGHLAVFGHTPLWSPLLVERLEPIYRPRNLWGPPPEAWYLPEGPVAGLIEASGPFGAVTHRGYSWRRPETREDFIAYLQTRSDHIVIEESVREVLFAEMAAALPDAFETHWATNLYLAQVL